MVAIYARQSVEKKNSLSIEGQIDICKRQIADNEKIKIYHESKSGKNTTDRAKFLEMQEDIKKGKITKVIVYKLDRISRNVLDFCKIWESFKQYNITFVSCSEQFDTSTPMGEAMIMIAMVFSQMERNAIIERVTDNYFKRAEQGFYLGGYAPFGFKKIDIIHLGKKTAGYIKDENTVDRLRQIFYDYADTNISLGKLAEQLTKENLSTARGKYWTGGGLGRILRSPVYVKADTQVYKYMQNKGATMNNGIEEYIGDNGCYLYAPQVEQTAEERDNKPLKKKMATRKFSDLSTSFITLAPHNGIISADVWLKCQYKLDNNKQIKCDRSGTHTWMSGLMRCENCGYGINVVNNNRGHFYINCYGKKLHICEGRKKVWEVYQIENIVEKELFNRLHQLQNIEAKEIVSDTNPKIEQLRVTSVKLETRIENMIDELEDAKEQQATARIKILRKRLDEIGKELDETNVNIHKLLNEDYNRKKNIYEDMNIKYIIENWNNEELIPFNNKKKIAKIIIQHIIIGNESVYIVFY